MTATTLGAVLLIVGGITFVAAIGRSIATAAATESPDRTQPRTLPAGIGRPGHMAGEFTFPMRS